MTATQEPLTYAYLPSWLPQDARRYLAHTACGQSIRALARADACHPSTVLRQVRRFENRREDPLLDGALDALSVARPRGGIAAQSKGKPAMNVRAITPATTARPIPLGDMSEDEIDRALCDILRRLCEPGAVLAVARDLDRAVIVREDKRDGSAGATAVVRVLAEALSLRDWISCPKPGGALARYFVTSKGREAFRRLTAAQENRAQGLRAQTDRHEAERRAELARRHAPESPLVGLARRRDRDGMPFLNRAQVAAGERLREDFELSAVRLHDPEGWDAAFTAHPDDLPPGTHRARVRALSALRDLGTGLSDVALRCCCLLEGLETTERTMGWSARSGKVVLRIALDRLSDHYASASEADNMIG
jgi:hypothetical protein